MTRRNILLILTDQHRYDIVGANGSRICQSPNLDRLASEGTRFEQAYSICPLCTPTRSSVYTGVLPHRHGLTRNMDALQAGTAIPTDIPTLAERLNEQRYDSYFLGKWHAGARPPSACGFRGMDVSGYGVIRNHPEYGRYLDERGLQKPTVTPVGVGWAHNLLLAGVMSGPVEASVPCFLAERAIGYLEQAAAGDNPFLMALNFWGPHAPYFPSEPYASMYDPESIPPWGNFYDTFEGKPPIYRRYRDAFIGEGQPVRSWEECARWAALYFGFATQIDAQIGRVIEALERLGLAEETAVLFSSDHGGMTGAHGGIHDKDGIMSQELLHVPMIGRLPREGARGQTSTLPCSNLDLAPTVVELAGCEVPESFDGRSLLPILKGERPPDWPDHVVSEFFGGHFAYETRVVVHGDIKYVYHPAAFDELYDLSEDPWEMHNLIDVPEYRPHLRACRERLIAWAKASGDDLTVLSGLFERRLPADSLAPYSPQAMDDLRKRPPELLD